MKNTSTFRFKNLKKTSILFITLISILQTACLSIVGNKLGLKNKSPELQEINVKNKEVCFLGMTHLAKKEFYDNTKKIIEDLQSKGFVCYVESVSNLDSTKKQIDSSALRKLRKLTNLDLALKYSESNLPIFKKLTAKYGLVDQPRYEILGAINYKRVDYHYTELIQYYEKKFEPIVLDSCDYKTPFKTKYNCASLGIKNRNLFIKEILIKERNILIAKTILNSTDSKIVIVYGKKHYEGIVEELKVLTLNK